MKKVLLSIFALSGASYSIYSQTLDANFDIDGIKTESFSSTPSNDLCYAAYLQNDGKMVYVGRDLDATNRFIARINSNGTFDTSFNNYGFIKFSGSNYECVTIQNDGKIIATGADHIIRLNIDGTVDTSFNIANLPLSVNGKLFTSKSITLQADGKIIIAGYANNETNTNNDVAIIRLNTDGTYDNSFDVDGKMLLAIGTSSDEAYDIKLQNDGKIIVACQTSNAGIYDICLIRLNSDGSFDTTFDTDGKVITTFGSSIYTRSIDLQADGKILVLTSSNVLRYNSNGSLDTTFDTDGIITLPFTVSNTTSVQPFYSNKPKVKCLSNNKILISCSSSSDFKLVQLNSNGSIDTTFGVNGIATYNERSEISNYLFVRTDNKIVTGGIVSANPYKIKQVLFSSSGIQESDFNVNFDQGSSIFKKIIQISNGSSNYYPTMIESRGTGTMNASYNEDGSFLTLPTTLSTTDSGYKMVKADNNNFFVSYLNPVISKYNQFGSKDPSFGINGVLNFSLNTPNYLGFIDEIYYNPNDGYLYVGFDYNESIDNPATGFYSYGVCRLTTNGSIDTTFGVNGYAKTRFDYFGTTSNEYPSKIMFQSDGKIVVVGFLFSNSDYIIGITRFNSNGTLDTSFGTNGKITTALNSRNAPINSIMLSNNKFLINTTKTIGNAITTSILKYNSDGTLDTSFGTNGVVNENENFRIIQVENSGKIIKAGQKNNHITTSRYNTDGTLDTTYGASGYLTTPVNYYSHANDALITSDNNLLVCGYSYDGNNNLATIIKYTNLTLGVLNFENNKKNILVYPNPIEEEVTFEYSLKNDEIISIDILDMQGKVIKSIVENKKLTAGDFKQNINLSNGFKTGSYFLRFTTKTGSQTLQLLKK